MSTPDAPDWQRVVQTVQSTGAVPDAPDWQRVVVGPGGAPVGGGGGGGGSGLTPAIYGWQQWSAPLWTITNYPAWPVGNGSILLVGMVAESAATWSSAFVRVINVGTSPTPNSNYVGLYAATVTSGSLSSLELVASSAAGAADNAWTVAGFTPVDFATAYKVTAGTLYYAAFLLDMGGQPAIGGPQGTIFGLDSAIPLSAYATGPYSALPSSLTSADLTALPQTTFWAGVA